MRIYKWALLYGPHAIMQNAALYCKLANPTQCRWIEMMCMSVYGVWVYVSMYEGVYECGCGCVWAWMYLSAWCTGSGNISPLGKRGRDDVKKRLFLTSSDMSPQSIPRVHWTHTVFSKVHSGSFLYEFGSYWTILLDIIYIHHLGLIPIWGYVKVEPQNGCCKIRCMLKPSGIWLDIMLDNILSCNYAIFWGPVIIQYSINT